MKKKLVAHNKPVAKKSVGKKNAIPEEKPRIQKKPFSKNKVLLYQKIGLFIIAFAVFANGIPNGFNMDDQYYTTKTNRVAAMGVKAIPRIFTTHTLYDNSDNSFDYRPIPMLTFALQHQFISASPQVSHVINVAIYAFSCVLIFSLLCLWFGESQSWFAFFVTLIYAVHPLHTEVVDSIKSRDELMATFFVLLSMVFSWKWYKTRKVAYWILSIILFIIALLCKKTIAPYIFIIPLVFYFFTDLPIKKVILFFVSFFVFFLIARFAINKLLLEHEISHRVFLYFENPFYTTKSTFWIKTATACYVMGWYLYLHFIPYPLSFYYGYAYVPLVNWSNILVILSLLVYLLLGYFVVKNIRKKSIAVFGAVIYLVNMAPYSNVLKPAPGMMAERFAYAASLGFCILICSALYYLYKIPLGSFTTSKNKKYFIITISFIFISYSAISINRNTDWESSYILYSHDIKHLQASGKANMLYGEQMMQRVGYYKRQLANAPGPEKNMYWDSTQYFIGEEKAAFENVLNVSPAYSKAINNLAVAYIHEDSFQMAMKYLVKARSLAPLNPDIRYNLGMVFGNMGIKNGNDAYIDSAIGQFKQVIHLSPKHIIAYKSLAMLLLRQGDTTLAMNVLGRGIDRMPQQSILDIELAKIYLSRNDTTNTIYYYEKAVETPNPNAALIKLLQRFYLSKNNIERANYYKNKLSQLAPAPQEDE